MDLDRSDEIASAYVKLFSSEEGTPEYEECFWAFDALEELTRLAPNFFVDQIARILALGRLRISWLCTGTPTVTKFSPKLGRM